MNGRIRWILAVWVIAVTATGCTGHRSACPGTVVAHRPPGEPLPYVEPTSLEVDPLRVPEFHADRETDPPPEYVYRGLCEEQVQCRAVANSEIGNSLDDEGNAHAPPKERHRQQVEERERKQHSLRQRARHLAAIEARNQDAAVALNLFFDLARAEASLQLLAENRAQLDELIEKAERTFDQGLPLPEEVELAVLTRRKILLEERFVQAELAVVRLNSELNRRLGLMPEAGERLWPSREWYVPMEPIDLDRAVRAAFAHRAELQMLRMLLHELDTDTLGVARDFLSSLNPLLGSAESARPIAARIPLLRSHVAASAEQELAARRAQIAELLDQRERVVTQEVKQAAHLLTARAKLVALTRARMENLQERRDETAREVESGVRSSFELAAASLEVQQAKAELLESVAEWEKARIELKLAQGAFVPECVTPP